VGPGCQGNRASELWAVRREVQSGPEVGISAHASFSNFIIFFFFFSFSIFFSFYF
jgi:hypothetical protein